MAVILKTDQPLLISCYIRTLNEEGRIGDVISRAKVLCEQVVIVDSGSIDATIEIAERNGAEVVHQEWLGNGHQKRVGESHCRHNWLLDLDADEVLSSDLIEEIRSEFARTGPICDVYEVPLTIVDPTDRIWHRAGVSYRAKLYNRHVAEMPAERAWDQFTIGPDVRVHLLRSPLYHYAFSSMGHLVCKQELAMRNRVAGMQKGTRRKVQTRIAFAFPFYFLKYFVVKGLWRVGLYGLCFSFVCAFSRWGRDVKLYERDWLRRDPEASDENSSPGLPIATPPTEERRIA